MCTIRQSLAGARIVLRLLAWPRPVGFEQVLAGDFLFVMLSLRGRVPVT